LSGIFENIRGRLGLYKTVLHLFNAVGEVKDAMVVADHDHAAPGVAPTLG